MVTIEGPVMSDISQKTQRFRLDIAYDGSFFHGWAHQEGIRTVAGVLEEKLSTILRQDVVLHAAGRTDAGVHAAGQVAHMDVVEHPALQDLSRFLQRCAKFLPDDVRIKNIARISSDFDARFSALNRHYVYTLSNSLYGVDPVHRHRVVHYPRPLDLALLEEASQLLVGLHDFGGFCRYKENATTIRKIVSIDWLVHDSEIEVHIIADAFCWSMVRAIVGALLEVGSSRKKPQWIRELLSRTKRESDVVIAPAHGLSLVSVTYPEESQYALRAQHTKARRDITHSEDVNSFC